MKVTFVENATTGGPSTRLDHYATNVAIYMGVTKVGSADVSAFTKDGSVYSATIPLTGAVVKEGSANRVNFYVEVTGATNID